MKITTTLTLSGAVALALGLAPLALAQAPPTTATSTATASQTTQAPTNGTHKTATPARPRVTASKSEIRQAQQALVKLGYNLNVDGMMGPHTRKALRKFQKINGIPQSGRLDTDTKRGLGLIGGQPVAGLNLGGHTTARVSRNGQGSAPSNAMPMSTSGAPMQQTMQTGQQGMQNNEQTMQTGQQGMQSNEQTMGTMHRGMLGKQQIMHIQRVLDQKGYHVPVTGTWGRQSRQALTMFQRKNNLNVTGHPDSATLRALGMMPNPSRTNAPSPATY